MYLRRLIVKNFRSLRNITLALNPGKSIIVGKNNSGKSNIIRAIDLLLGEEMPFHGNICQDDFFAEKIGAKTRRSDFFFLCAELAGDFDPGPLKEWMGTYLYRLKDVDLLRDIAENNLKALTMPFGEITAKTWRVGRQLAEILQKGESHILLYLFVPADFAREPDLRIIYNFAVDLGDAWHRGVMSKELRSALVTSAIIPSFRNPVSQLKIDEFTWYGRLIRGIYEGDLSSSQSQANHRRQIETIGYLLGQAKENMDHIFGKAKDEIDRRTSRIVPHSGIRFKIMADDPDDMYRNVTLYVDDGVEAKSSEKGAGIQSALILSLFRYYCKHFHRGSSLLAIEEPEIFLHPHARRYMSAELDQMAKERIQVILSTHCTDYFQNTDLKNIIITRKPSDHEGTVIYRLGEESIARIEGSGIAPEMLAENGEIFFSDKVILVEGTPEKSILETVARMELEEIDGSRNMLDGKNISVISVGDKGSLCAYMHVLRSLGITSFVIADLDLLNTEISSILEYLQNHAQIQRESLEPMRRSLVRITGFLEKEFALGGSRSEDLENLLESSGWRELYWVARRNIGLGLDAFDERHHRFILDRLSALEHQFLSSLRMKNMVHNENINRDISLVIVGLRRFHIYILSRGDLEDYYLEKVRSLGTLGRERRARAASRAVIEQNSTEGYLDSQELRLILKSIVADENIGDEFWRYDRAMDRLVYDAYDLSERERKAIENTLWGSRFEEMYSRLPRKDEKRGAATLKETG